MDMPMYYKLFITVPSLFSLKIIVEIDGKLIYLGFTALN